MTRILLPCLFLLAMQNLLAQATEFPTGLLPEDSTYQQLPRLSEFDGTKANLPNRVSLEQYCPEVGNQGDIFSCVGWSVGYGALTIQRAIHNGCTDRAVITQNAHSALFIYNQIKEGDCRQGARISDAVRFLMEHGDCLAGQFDYDRDNCQLLPDAQLQQQAQRFAIEDFLTLFDQGSSEREKIAKTKMAIARQKPVIIGMQVRRNFYQLENARFWWPDNGNTAPAGGHAMVVVGYDDIKGAFRLFNSWGSQWGDRGFIWVKYRDFARFCKYAYILYLLESDQFDTPLTTDAKAAAPAVQVTTAVASRPKFRPLVKLGGQFGFRQFKGWDAQQQPQFQSAEVYFEEGYYRTEQSEWAVGQKFQLLVQTTEQDEYLYVFSIDARRNVHIHFPRKGKYNRKFRGRNESALLLSGGAQAIIPGPQKVLKKSHAGRDKLIVLYAKKKIPHFRKLCRAASQYNGNFVDHLWKLLEEQVVPRKEILYHPEEMSFTASTRSGRYVVPIVLEIEGN
ncbi:MAG: C1 family peptidase [Bacteroidota bacterium]